MKIYNVIVEWNVDGDSCGSPKAYPYVDFDKACDRFMVEVHSAQNDAQEDWQEEYDNLNREETDKYYALWEEGWWDSNHIKVRLDINEVE